MNVKFPGFPSLLVLVCVPLVLFACGGSGAGVTNGATATSDFLTADTQGLAGDVALAGPGGVAGLENQTDDAASAAHDLASEIEAADLYRVDGTRLYLLSSFRGLVVIDLAARHVLGRVALSGTPNELYVSGDRAFVLVAAFDGGGSLHEISLANPSAPHIDATLPLSGAPYTSRKIGDRIVVVTRGLGASHVQSFAVGAGLTAIADETLSREVDYAHANGGMLFLASNAELGTFVQIVDVSDPTGLIAQRGAITLAGSIGAEDRLDRSAGILRVVTRVFDPIAVSRLYTVDVSNPDFPHVRGQIDVGHGEQTFAARFGEERGYIVTFEQVDPLWVIDLSNPDHPTVSGHLIVPGWSSQLVAWNDRLVAWGADPTGGWHTTVSLFDVSNPAAPALTARVAIGSNLAGASDPKAFGVFPESGLVLVPGSDEVNGLAVLDLAPNALTLRGWIDTHEVPLRGFANPVGLCALTTTGVHIANPSNLASVDEIIVAEDVIDAGRIEVGGTSRIATLVVEGDKARIGSVVLPLSPDRMYPHGSAAAVTGWDSLGHAAYVVDFATPTPHVSPRIDLGSPFPSVFASQTCDASLWWGGAARGFDASLTANGRLIVRGVSDAPADLVIGDGEAREGFVVIDVDLGVVEWRIQIRGATTTGVALDGETLAVSLARAGGVDPFARPLLRHGFRRIDLATLAITADMSVPGALVALDGDLVTTSEEMWDEGWTVRSSIVVSRITAGAIQVLDRLRLPENAFDLRTAGSTLYYTVGSSYPIVLAGDFASIWLPATEIHTLRLGTTLAHGPTIDLGDTFATLLLAEETGALVVRNGVELERIDVSGPVAVSQWQREVGIFPRTARPDAETGGYLVSLGRGGLAHVP